MSAKHVVTLGVEEGVPSGSAFPMLPDEATEKRFLSEDALLRSTMDCYGQGLAVRRLQADLPEANNYQIGLIPRENLGTGSDSRLPELTHTNSVVVLPLTWTELVGHIRAEVKEPGSTRVDESIHFGSISVNFYRMEIVRSGEKIRLTALQFKVLHYFVKHPGRVISRDELLDKVWGYDNYPSTRTVDNILLRLRQGLESDPANPVHFHTVHGVGYKFLP